jgi:hypothetical protein
MVLNYIRPHDPPPCFDIFLSAYIKTKKIQNRTSIDKPAVSQCPLIRAMTSTEAHAISKLSHQFRSLTISSSPFVSRFAGWNAAPSRYRRIN